MTFLKKWFSQGFNDRSDIWCIAYIDANPFRLKSKCQILQEAGFEVQSSVDGLYVKKDQYIDVMKLIQNA